MWRRLRCRCLRRRAMCAAAAVNAPAVSQLRRYEQERLCAPARRVQARALRRHPCQTAGRRARGLPCPCRGDHRSDRAAGRPSGRPSAHPAAPPAGRPRGRLGDACHHGRLPAHPAARGVDARRARTCRPRRGRPAGPARGRLTMGDRSTGSPAARCAGCRRGHRGGRRRGHPRLQPHLPARP